MHSAVWVKNLFSLHFSSSWTDTARIRTYVSQTHPYVYIPTTFYQTDRFKSCYMRLLYPREYMKFGKYILK